MSDSKKSHQDQMAEAIQRLLKELRAGLEHGHFNYTITCELENGRKRALTIICGRSYRFVIPEEDLRD